MESGEKGQFIKDSIKYMVKISCYVLQGQLVFYMAHGRVVVQ